MVPLNINGIWGITDKQPLNEWSPRRDILHPPINIYPLAVFAIRYRACKILDFPAPVLPTIPTF